MEISMKLGEKQTLTVVKIVDFGVYLSEPGKKAAEAGQRSPAAASCDAARVLLPKKQVPEGTRIGDSLCVFLYRDSEDRPIATMREPLLVIGGIAALKVVAVSRVGAFLDWGLEKDLFLPYKEQLSKVSKGEEILVTLYVDKSGRLCATMRGLYRLLATDSPYGAGDAVRGRVYEFSKNFGTFVAVDDRYSAMLPLHEDTASLRIGDLISATVSNVKEDGKLDLTLRRKAYLEMDDDAETVLQLIKKYHGELPFNDKASPELIRREAHMSKSAFKRAVGRLYKEHRIEIKEQSLKLLPDSPR